MEHVQEIRALGDGQQLFLIKVVVKNLKKLVVK